jgi:LacI family transcriptional regulator
VVRKSTARDVAFLAGVSPATVDRVLNNRGGVHSDKERAVLEAARRLKLDRALDLRASRTMRIAVLIQAADNPFHAAVQAAFAAANRSYADLNLQFRIFHADPAATLQAARAVEGLSTRHEGLILSCPRSEAISEAVARAAGRIPVLTFATDLPTSGRHVYIGPDNRRAGRVAGDLMGRFLRPVGGTVVMIAGLLSMIGHEEREIGFRSVLRERYPECNLGPVLESRERGDLAGRLVFEALRSNPDVRGVYNASTGSHSVVDALEALGRQREVVFITHELTDDRRALLEAGLIDAIIDQNPDFEVRTAVETMANLLGRVGGAPPPPITPIHIHMIENA